MRGTAAHRMYVGHIVIHVARIAQLRDVMKGLNRT